MSATCDSERRDSPDPWGLCTSAPWYRWPILGRIQRWYSTRFDYVRLSGEQSQILAEAIRHVPWKYRILRQTVSVSDIDCEYGQNEGWKRIRDEIEPGDLIWPFLINPWTMAMRTGFLVVRRRRPVNLFVTAMS